MEKRMDETMDAEKFLKELIHRALLGDHEAQQECTEKRLCCRVLIVAVTNFMSMLHTDRMIFLLK